MAIVQYLKEGTSEDIVGSTILFSKESLGYRIYAAEGVYAIVLYFKKIRWAKILFWLEIVMELVSKANY